MNLRSRRRRWTVADVPDQSGRTVVVTGGNTGLGFQAARVLAGRDATVVLACRNPTRAADAAARLHDLVPKAHINTVQLDLASLSSIRGAAEQLRSEHPRIDVLINNAGGMVPHYGRTEDGFEATLGTNHLGPFAFTGLVLEQLLAVPGSRIVTVSSIGHRRGDIDFDDLQFEDGYRYSTAYSRSKLANLLFTYELQRRLASGGAQTIAVASHPGNARTELGRNLPAAARLALSPKLRMFTWWLLQNPSVGALAAVRAATDPQVRGGEYYGPPGRAQFVGYPARVDSSARSHDTELQRRLWLESERLTGVRYPARLANASAG